MTHTQKTAVFTQTEKEVNFFPLGQQYYCQEMHFYKVWPLVAVSGIKPKACIKGEHSECQGVRKEIHRARCPSLSTLQKLQETIEWGCLIFLQFILSILRKANTKYTHSLKMLLRSFPSPIFFPLPLANCSDHLPTIWLVLKREEHRIVAGPKVYSFVYFLAFCVLRMASTTLWTLRTLTHLMINYLIISITVVELLASSVEISDPMLVSDCPSLKKLRVN